MKKKNLVEFFAVLLFLILWSLLLYFIGPQRIVSLIGAQNIYLVLFIIGTVGGVSTLTSATFYTSLTAFALGGANPFLLGIAGGLGITIGDSLFYYLGKKGQESLATKARRITLKFSNWLNQQPSWVVPVVTFVYAGLTPLPNDILMVTLGVSRYKYTFLILPLILGNILLSLLVAFFAGAT
ncbi:hypothetical protein K9M74_04000 [Candidatus Woesearchaeota archaeon]|nr:hypothetical protein [Candidatus Woesearchaeota archaeon]